RVAVRSRRNHRVEGIGDGEQPGLDRNSASAQSRRVAVSVPPLVMEEDVREGVVEAAHLDDESGAGGRVASNLGELLGREPTGLPEQLRPNLHLADVVQRRGPAKRADAVTLPAELERDGLGERRDAGAVAKSLVALLECACDRGEHARTDSAPGPGLLP